MKALRTLICFFLIVCLLPACSGTKRMAKKAMKYEEKGLYKEAARYYMESLRRDKENIDAQLGLQTNGQKVLDDMFREFDNAQAANNDKVVVYGYLEAKEYYDQVMNMGVRLDYPAYYDDYYKESKSRYISQVYEQADHYFDRRDFAKAEALYSEVISLNPEYRQAKEKRLVAVVEPLYVKASEAFEQQKYRTAYNYFDKVLGHDRDYKDAQYKKAEALEFGQLTIGMLPFRNLTYERRAEERVAAYFMNEMVNTDNPFIKVIDREHTQRLLQEQHMGLSGMMDESSAAEAGKMIGVKAVLTGKLITYDERNGRLKKTKHRGKEKYRVKIKVDSTDSYVYEDRYRTVYYYEYENWNEVLVSFQYNLISSETGEILFSDVVEKKYDDKIHYAYYKGDPDDLYPLREGKIVTGRAKRQLKDMLRSRKKLKSPESMAKDAFRSVAREMKNQVLVYERNRE